MIFFKLYDWDKDGAITEKDINSILSSNEHTMHPKITAEVELYSGILSIIIS